KALSVSFRSVGCLAVIAVYLSTAPRDSSAHCRQYSRHCPRRRSASPQDASLDSTEDIANLFGGSRGTSGRAHYNKPKCTSYFCWSRPHFTHVPADRSRMRTAMSCWIRTSKPPSLLNSSLF